ncbi:MAG: ABC transporter ATP-binding protein [Lachnospiraceae bacterium]|nr:ABC transporter ATP-binding protein [Lachnospiraceae bacterium]
MIEIEHLTKKYGNHTAVDDLNLTIEPGRIYGFLGPNGAGKSTTMNIITGYLAASDGTVKIGGYDIYKEANKAKALIGYLPEIPPLYPDMTVLEYLEFVAELKKIPRADRQSEVDEACVMTGISDVAGRLIRNLSKGYKQRVGLAQAILGKPEIIILDEPTVGLDPAQIIEVRDLIRDLGKDHTVILSSHILSEISEVCNYVFIISKGKLVASDETDRLLSNMNGSREIDVTLSPDGNEMPQDITGLFAGITGVDSIETGTSSEPGTAAIRIHTSAEADIRADVFRTAVKNGLIILEMTGRARSLEDVFLELTQTDDTADTDTADTDIGDTDAVEGGEE